MKTLIVEDDFSTRLLLQRWLAEYGTSDIAVNGKEALEAFTLAHAESDTYDLIILDIMMPEMDGQDALKEIREFEKENDVPPRDEVFIVMLTALDSPSDVIKAYFEGGCTFYLTKPIIKAELFNLLKVQGLISE